MFGFAHSSTVRAVGFFVCFEVSAFGGFLYFEAVAFGFLLCRAQDVRACAVSGLICQGARCSVLGFQCKQVRGFEFSGYKMFETALSWVGMIRVQEFHTYKIFWAYIVSGFGAVARNSMFSGVGTSEFRLSAGTGRVGFGIHGRQPEG